MFQRSLTDKRRVIIVDYMHMAWAYAFGQATSLSCVLNINGVSTVVDTTIPAYTIKALNRWSMGGFHPLAVCFDGVGSSRCRKAYFAKLFGLNTDGSAVAYKAGRESKDQKFYDGVAITLSKLLEGGVSCYKAANYEADDLIKACVDNAKKTYPNLPIDIITGDHDLLPLVDDQVSVFIRSRKTTYAESKDIEKPHYVQVTPRNFEEYLSDLNAYKNLEVPYNTVLLAKLLRGDKSDGIPGKSDWKPKMYKELIHRLKYLGYDLSELFRYDAPTETVVTGADGQPMIQYGEPPKLTAICEAFKACGCDDEDSVHVRQIYNGINLNGAFTGMGTFDRKPAVIQTPISGYDVYKLQLAVKKDLQIELKTYDW